ncbi:cytochrome P450 [Nocardioides daeguensis]|nr:cytochrome P450 [Nocardioides daeguensis]
MLDLIRLVEEETKRSVLVGDPIEIEVERGRGWVDDQRVQFDAMRARCPVARLEDAWLVLGHAEVIAAATDPVAFSSAVTARRAIPNSLDGPEHAAYRAVVDRYLTPERVSRVEPACREIAASIVAGLPRGETVKTLARIGIPYAVRSQSAWLGWPSDLQDELVTWIRDNHNATRSGDRAQTRAVAERFDRIIGSLVEARRDEPAGDVTAALMRETVHGRALGEDEIVSILRNWTAGDLGSLATSVGVIVHFLAARPEVQRQVRQLVADGEQAGLEAAVEEILRIDDPFVSNRRRTTGVVELGGESIPQGALVLLNWTAANRDPLVFGDPDAFEPQRHAEANLVFGIGPHICPGRALTLMELRVITEALVRETAWIELSTERPAVREEPPVGGWARVPVVLR